MRIDNVKNELIAVWHKLDFSLFVTKVYKMTGDFTLTVLVVLL